MKNLIFISILLLFINCTDNSEIDVPNEERIIGTWQLVERFNGGSPQPHQTVKNGYTIAFLKDGTSTSPTYECDQTYFVSENEITFEIPCISSKYNYNFFFKGDYLYLIAGFCDEGCWNKFKKIKN